MKKIVDGVEVDCTPEEIAQRQAEEADWESVRAARDAEKARRLAILSDPLRSNLLNQIKNATNAQISNYVDNNVTDLASARTMFKRILLLISLDQRDGG